VQSHGSLEQTKERRKRKSKNRATALKESKNVGGLRVAWSLNMEVLEQAGGRLIENQASVIPHSAIMKDLGKKQQDYLK